MKEMYANRVINGTFGRVWVDDELMGNCSSFEAKITGNYETINIAGKLGEAQKYLGFSGAGSMTMKKIDSSLVKKIADGYRTGELPEIKIVALLEDPASYGKERVALYGVTFDETTLSKFEVKAPIEEEFPFKFEDYEFLDTI